MLFQFEKALLLATSFLFSGKGEDQQARERHLAITAQVSYRDSRTHVFELPLRFHHTVCEFYGKVKAEATIGFHSISYQERT